MARKSNEYLDLRDLANSADRCTQTQAKNDCGVCYGFDDGCHGERRTIAADFRVEVYDPNAEHTTTVGICLIPAICVDATSITFLPFKGKAERLFWRRHFGKLADSFGSWTIFAFDLGFNRPDRFRGRMATTDRQVPSTHNIPTTRKTGIQAGKFTTTGINHKASSIAFQQQNKISAG